MTPDALITTTVLMGLLVLAGGAWAVLYCVGRMRARGALVRAGIASYGVALALALVIAVVSPLDFGWKLLIVASALAYAAIPPITLRYLERMHSDEEAHS
ncbi:MAG: hypothetical protein OJF60_001802 [Burkholderiaceae bacterium]|jgi:hypothetical protein|nr:MAG: hypothetical protein OJF60_001802 [Burkholderiaceae bacterium]